MSPGGPPCLPTTEVMQGGDQSNDRVGQRKLPGQGFLSKCPPQK